MLWLSKKAIYICITLQQGNSMSLTATGGALAQLVEQWTENPCVPGSIPGGTTLKP